MNVLSLFDGMSCGQIALKELGIEPDIYYASEIDKFAIKQTQLNTILIYKQITFLSVSGNRFNLTGQLSLGKVLDNITRYMI